MIILGLGSNIGNSHAYLEKAINKISKELLSDIERSNVYESDPMLPDDAPEEWSGMQFLNMAISGKLKTELTPVEFLAKIKEIETSMGRDDKAARWAPREIDIDILAWDNLELNIPDLQIPHYGLTERAFAIIPFAELAPDWKHPRSQIKAIDYAKQFTI